MAAAAGREADEVVGRDANWRRAAGGGRPLTTSPPVEAAGGHHGGTAGVASLPFLQHADGELSPFPAARQRELQARVHVHSPLRERDDHLISR